MKRLTVVIELLFIILSSHGQQHSRPATVSSIPYSYHAPSTVKPSWQRLNLWLSATFLLVVNEGQSDLDTYLIQASRSLGLSRLSILAEGIDDPALLAQSQWVDQHNPGEGMRRLSQAREKKHLELLILLGAYYAFQPSNYHRYRDSVEYFLTKAISESKGLKEEKLGRQASCLLGKMYIQANQLKKGDSILAPLIKECEAAGDNETLARAFSYRGTYTPLAPATWQNMIADLQKAADIYHRLNNTEGEINALTDIGYLFVLTSQPQQSYDALLKAFQLEESIGYPYTQYNADVLALVTQIGGKYGEPLKYSLQSIRAAESSLDSIGWAYFYDRLATLYSMVDADERKDQEWLHKAVDRFLLDRNPHVYNSLLNLINRMSDEGRGKEALDLVNDIAKNIPPVNLKEQIFYNMAYTSCYTTLKKFEMALMYLSKVDSLETIAESIRGPLRRDWITSQFGHIYFGQGEYRKAKMYFEKSFTSGSVLVRNFSGDLIVYRKLIYIDSVLQDHQAGLAHYRKFTGLLDSSFRVSKLRQAEELQVMYQTEDKEKEIASLNQKAKLEQANLKQATLIRDITIGGIVLLLIIAALLFRQTKLKQKNNGVIVHKNEQLQHLVNEKDWLVKEIHHRVKNNFQTVMGLLGTQAGYQKNDVAVNAITDSQRRIQSMSLIHQKLYQSNNLSAIKMPDYVHELLDTLSESFNSGNHIRFNLEIEPIELDLAHCIPLGLILNEAITNSFKYAFPLDSPGIISISFRKNSADELTLTITDNGRGLPSSFDIHNSKSMGMNLMKGLSEEIGAGFKIGGDNGTQITVSFENDADMASEISQMTNKQIQLV
ncbi:MAG: sensor histidine kinase [Ferruginibacter sp.]|nr:sensor histidine kinase [Ferruginibacter sp.]